MTSERAALGSSSLLQNAWELHRNGDHARAEQLYRAALRQEPRNFDALYRLGFLYGERGKFDDAQRILAAAIELAPGASDVHFLRGCALLNSGRHEEALVCLDHAIALRPEFLEALFNRAVVLVWLGRYGEALEAVDGSLALEPKKADALVTRAMALKALARVDEAKASYDRALAIDPGCIDALLNRGTILFEKKQYEEAAEDCERALALNPDLDYMPGFLLYFRLQCCNWRNLGERERAVAAGLAKGKRVIQPFMNLARIGTLEEQFQCARIWAASECPPAPRPLWRGERYRHDRIRVAYISEDFRVHPVAQAIAGVFEQHDRSRFEVTAVSLGPDDGSDVRSRIARGCERFLDVSRSADADVATLLRDAEIDVAVDLMGFTGRSRSQILSRRPAPVQVSYLGFPATMGADYVDYIIADRVTIREEDQRYYREKIAYLPDSYMATDTRRLISSQTPTRSAAGLPEAGFVFASFNGPYKIVPRVFDVWMRLLNAADGSVLWLPESNAAAKRNLVHEAQARGIRTDRLVFAPRLEAPADHLARLRLADLFLDTSPYGAHSTASDALWAGLPVLTCAGATFASRVAASLNRAAGLPEMVTDTIEDYEALALKLARDPSLLSGIKAKLAKNREIGPLFDTARFTRAIEAAYTAMRERTSRGLRAANIAVAVVN